MANKYHSIEINYVVTEKTSDDNDNASVKNENKSGDTNDKEEVQFHETKVAFVAGVVVIMTIIYDAIDSLCSIPIWGNLVVFLIGVALFLIVLGTKTFDGLINKNIEGVERFGSNLTLASIIVFLFERLILDDKNEIVSKCFLLSNKQYVAVIFIVLAVLIVPGSFLLLCSGKSKKEHKE